jgi:FAD/FMN-containing dehydrogenase
MSASPIVTRSSSALDQFAAGLAGHVVRPGDPTYDEARLSWNRRFDPRPSMIVRAANAADVAATVRLARAQDLPLTIRSGGHSLAGYSSMDDAILLDLGDLRSMHIDAEARLAQAGPGLRSAEYGAAAQAYGLATPHGDTGTVGIGGLTLGGGIGWLARKYGLTIDSLVEVEMVTADGDIITVDAEREPELFWGLRGGGGNLGIATRFTSRLHPVDRFMGGAIVLPATADVVSEVLAAAAAAPDGLTTIPVLMRVPPLPFVPAEYHGTLGFVVMVAWVGSNEAGQRALAPIRAIAPAWGDMVAPMPYPAIYSLTEMAGKPTVDVSRSTFLDVLDRSTLASLIEGMAAAPSPMAMIQLRVLGGAVAGVSSDATAFAHRSARIMAVIIDLLDDPAELPDHEAWVASMYDLIARDSTGVYVNFLHREGEDRIHAAYPGATYRRLLDLKRRWDPSNLFRNNQNIQP